MDDCIKYQKDCEACQRFGNIQIAPAGIMNSIMKSWPFRGCGLYFINEIHPRSSKGHRFILVATDYFTKLTEVVPLRNMTHREVIILCRNTLSIGLGPSNSNNRSKTFIHVTPI
jgi:hypothetical protein